MPPDIQDILRWISQLASNSPEDRQKAANALFILGSGAASDALSSWSTNKEFAGLLRKVNTQKDANAVRATVGIAVEPGSFAQIRTANGSPHLADVPPDQDAQEFELHFSDGVRLDILTTKQPGGDGAMAKFLAKFGEGIQQVEYDVSDVDRATQILAERFSAMPIYPTTRPGADGTRVNFFLVPSAGGKKILIELVEPARRKTQVRP